MSWEQRNADFCKGMADAQMAYIEAEREVKRLQDENAELRELAKEACELARVFFDCGGTFNDLDDLLCEASELGIEVQA